MFFWQEFAFLIVAVLPSRHNHLCLDLTCLDLSYTDFTFFYFLFLISPFLSFYECIISLMLFFLLFYSEKNVTLFVINCFLYLEQ